MLNSNLGGGCIKQYHTDDSAKTISLYCSSNRAFAYYMIIGSINTAIVVDFIAIHTTWVEVVHLGTYKSLKYSVQNYYIQIPLPAYAEITVISGRVFTLS